MLQEFTQNEASAAKRRAYMHLVDETDMGTPETGEAGGQPQQSINGGSFSNTSGTLVHIGNGTYYVQLTAAELSTVGSFALRFKSAETAEAVCVYSVVALTISNSRWTEIIDLLEDLSVLLRTTKENKEEIIETIQTDDFSQETFISDNPQDEAEGSR